MKKLLSFSLFALVVVAVVVACSDSGSSTPVAPAADDSANLPSVTGARSNSTPELICHHTGSNSNIWTVIEKDNSQLLRHCLNHGDYENGADGNDSNSCPDCNLSGLEAGDWCCHSDGGQQSCDGTI
jgi:hypothetical protein